MNSIIALALAIHCFFLRLLRGPVVVSRSRYEVRVLAGVIRACRDAFILQKCIEKHVGLVTVIPLARAREAMMILRAYRSAIETDPAVGMAAKIQTWGYFDRALRGLDSTASALQR